MSEPSKSVPLGRRDFVRGTGLGAVALGLGVGRFSGTSATRAPLAKGLPTGPDLFNFANLYCDVAPVILDSTGVGTVMVTCGNFGPDGATHSVSLKFVTPFYLNVTSLPSVKHATSSWVYQNTAVDVPLIIQVTWANGIAANTSVTVPISVKLDTGCPDIAPSGRAIFTTDPSNVTDLDLDLTRNAPVASILDHEASAPPLATATWPGPTRRLR
jgi:hypothetical protein